MRDFLGTPLNVGDFVARGGGGNAKAEYGMILFQIVEVGDKPRLVRLTSDYNPTTIKAKKSTIKNFNRYVKVKPSAKVKALFKRGVAGKLRKGEADMIAGWIHGATHQPGLFAG